MSLAQFFRSLVALLWFAWFAWSAACRLLVRLVVRGPLQSLMGQGIRQPACCLVLVPTPISCVSSRLSPFSSSFLSSPLTFLVTQAFRWSLLRLLSSKHFLRCLLPQIPCCSRHHCTVDLWTFFFSPKDESSSRTKSATPGTKEQLWGSSHDQPATVKPTQPDITSAILARTGRITIPPPGSPQSAGHAATDSHAQRMTKYTRASVSFSAAAQFPFAQGRISSQSSQR
jgi:hypothetical protein